MLKKSISVALMSAYLAVSAVASAPEENVVIISAVEEYTFAPGVDGPEIINSITTEYQATRRAEKIQPHIFHSKSITLDKVSGGKAQYRNANSPTVFHDDSKVCYLDIHLDRKDKKAKVHFKRTFTDGAQFTGVFPAEEYPIRNKKIIFRIPGWLPEIDLVERNFPGQGIIRSEEPGPEGGRIITYTVTSLPEIPDDKNKPSALSTLAHIMVKGYFPDCDSLYRYNRRLMDVDTVIPDVNSIVHGIIKDTRDRDGIISRLYRYVQQNIRYVAFEAGEAAFRPDSPSEVLRKRYGDCKGMSLLLATLLRRCGIEACIACVGTNEIPFRISEAPSLSAANHMICIVPEGDSYLFLDPTHRQISSRHIPEWICGKDAMMFTSDGYRMIDIPDKSPLVSEDMIVYRYHLTDEGLAGTVQRTATEDMAESLVQSYSEVPGQHLNELLAKAIIPVRRAAIPPDGINYNTDTPGRVTISAPILNQPGVIRVDNAVYLDLNTSGDQFTERIDTTDRRTDYLFPEKGRIVRSTSVDIPAGAKVSLPSDYQRQIPQADFSCRFVQEGNTVRMTKTLHLHDRRLPLKDIPVWNKALGDWKEACNQQIEIENLIP